MRLPDARVAMALRLARVRPSSFVAGAGLWQIHALLFSSLRTYPEQALISHGDPHCFPCLNSRDGAALVSRRDAASASGFPVH
jgi:hypothetical protein